LEGTEIGFVGGKGVAHTHTHMAKKRGGKGGK